LSKRKGEKRHDGLFLGKGKKFFFAPVEGGGKRNYTPANVWGRGGEKRKNKKDTTFLARVLLGKEKKGVKNFFFDRTGKKNPSPHWERGNGVDSQRKEGKKKKREKGGEGHFPCLCKGERKPSASMQHVVLLWERGKGKSVVPQNREKKGPSFP